MITEITRITNKDCYLLSDRHKKQQTYPLHQHEEMELNFIENCRGNRRVVGDSMEVTSDYDLVLLGGGLEHNWEQYECTSADIHEVTIQFSKDLFSQSFLDKTYMRPIADLFKRAELGVAFGMQTIMHVNESLKELSNMEPGFYSVMKFFGLIYELAKATDYRTLSSSAFAHAAISTDSRRVAKVKDFIDKNYNNEIRLQTLAELASMTESSFSRFFKLRTGKNLSEYVIDVRLGHASRLLADSTMTVVEICYHCGFNNISHFNRIFKKRKGCTPTEFRENYHKKHVIA